MDEQEFQKLAKSLINYDMAKRRSYEVAYSHIENVSFFSKFRVGLILFATVVNVISMLLLKVCYMDLNVILVVVFIISCVRFHRKLKDKSKSLNELEELRNDSVRQDVIQVMDEYVAIHPEWGVEAWWKTLSGEKFGKHDWHYNDYRVTIGGEQMVTDGKISEVKFHITDDVDKLNKKIHTHGCRCIKVSKLSIENFGTYSLIPLYFAGCETEDEGYHFTGRYFHIYYRVGTVVLDKYQNVLMILLNCNHVKVCRFLAYGAIPVENEEATNYVERDNCNIDIPIEEVLVKIGRAMKRWSFHLDVRFNIKRQEDFTSEEWAWWMYGQYDDWRELLERYSLKEYEDGRFVRN